MLFWGLKCSKTCIVCCTFCLTNKFFVLGVKNFCSCPISKQKLTITFCFDSKSKRNDAFFSILGVRESKTKQKRTTKFCLCRNSEKERKIRVFKIESKKRIVVYHKYEPLTSQFITVLGLQIFASRPKKLQHFHYNLQDKNFIIPYTNSIVMNYNKC
jgi:hypothetical protein